MAPTLNIVGFSGNIHRPSKTRTLVETVIERLAAREPQSRVNSEIFDLMDVMPELGTTLGGPALPARIEAVIARLSSADAIIVGSPVYKGSYTGLFKHFFDLVDPERLLGVPVVLTANGGGEKHALMVEHQMRPLFGFFSAHTIATSVYASTRDFADNRINSEALLERIDAAVSDLTIWLERAKRSKCGAKKLETTPG